MVLDTSSICLSLKKEYENLSVEEKASEFGIRSYNNMDTIRKFIEELFSAADVLEALEYENDDEDE